MPASLDGKLVVAVSSRALFDLDESHRVFEEEGVDAYARHQTEREDEPLRPGVAYPLIRKLLSLNGRNPSEPGIEVILLSRNSADTGLRIFNSIRHFGLPISRAVFTRGEITSPYVGAFGAHLFLSTNPDDVREAIAAGHAAATILPSEGGGTDAGQVRIAFDGDAVLFSDESERVFQESGLDAFHEAEAAAASVPLGGGPFKPFLAALQRIQRQSGDAIRTALVTARSAPAHERVVRTLRAWDIRIDEAIFLGGLPKGPFLKAFRADIFFDDQTVHCDSARQHVATGHVPHGIAQR